MRLPAVRIYTSPNPSSSHTKNPRQRHLPPPKYCKPGLDSLVRLFALPDHPPASHAPVRLLPPIFASTPLVPERAVSQLPRLHHQTLWYPKPVNASGAFVGP